MEQVCTQSSTTDGKTNEEQATVLFGENEKCIVVELLICCFNQTWCIFVLDLSYSDVSIHNHDWIMISDLPDRLIAHVPTCCLQPSDFGYPPVPDQASSYHQWEYCAEEAILCQLPGCALLVQ